MGTRSDSGDQEQLQPVHAGQEDRILSLAPKLYRTLDQLVGSDMVRLWSNKKDLKGGGINKTRPTLWMLRQMICHC